jgi:hypothetical protein
MLGGSAQRSDGSRIAQRHGQTETIKKLMAPSRDGDVPPTMNGLHPFYARGVTTPRHIMPHPRSDLFPIVPRIDILGGILKKAEVPVLFRHLKEPIIR